MKAIIVEDELHGLENLTAKLRLACPHVEFVGSARTAKDAVTEIKTKQPDLVFLDLHLGPANGFDILDELTYLSFQIIITTDHSEYGIQAVKAGATDYLIKPFDHKELSAAVEKAIIRKAKHPDQNNRIAIPVSEGHRLVALNEILYVKSNNQRTLFHLFNGKVLDSPRLLRQVIENLRDFDFHRIHRSYVVNRHYVEAMSNRDGGTVTMSDGAKLPVTHPIPFPKI